MHRNAHLGARLISHLIKACTLIMYDYASSRSTKRFAEFTLCEKILVPLCTLLCVPLLCLIFRPNLIPHLFKRYKGSNKNGSESRKQSSGSYEKNYGGNYGGMSRSEAMRILGTNPQSTKKEIMVAYRNRMKCCHPDRGGSTQDAQKINQARNVLL